MSIESDIVEWAATRPSWQRLVLRRIARGESFSAAEIQALVDQLVDVKPQRDEQLVLEDLPRRAESGPAVALLEIRNAANLNALRQTQPLTFGATGITVVYGDNASGKSGYSRLIKKLVRARHDEPILTDIFSDDGSAPQRAEVALQVGDSRHDLQWPDENADDAARICFFDGNCGEVYLTHESDVTYRPAALFVLEGLIQTCDRMREELDRRLAVNAAQVMELPSLDASTAAGRFLRQLSGETTVEQVDAACALPPESSAKLERIVAEETRLRHTDPAREAARLEGIATGLLTIAGHLVECERQLGERMLETLADLERKVAEKQAAADLATKAASFDSEPVPGVGSTAWRELWEAARAFVASALPESRFPPQALDERCPLCQQSVDERAAERLRRFEAFVQDATQQELQAALGALTRSRREAERFEVMPPGIFAGIAAAGENVDAVVQRARQALSAYEARHNAILESFRADPWRPPVLAEPPGVSGDLTRLAEQLRQEAGRLDPTTYQQLLDETVRARRELEATRALSVARESIVAEVARRAARARLELVKEATLTQGISRRAADLTREHVTAVVRDQFTRETDRLRLERVTLEDVGGRKGALQHQPAFVGAVQKAPLPRVLSEGEQTALGMAGFFTEVELEPSKSAVVLDDPVSSLDHVRRGCVAARLARLAHERQVIVFTHDTAFVVDLRLAARSEGVEVVERFIERFRGVPGQCSTGHPWKVKDVGPRLQVLEQELAQIRRERQELDQEHYESRAAEWSGRLSETWERVLSLEIAGRLFDRGTQEVRPLMFRMLAKITEDDDREFQTSYLRCSRWARRHDKSVDMNYVAPEPDEMAAELSLVRAWWERVKKYAQ